MNKDFLEYLCPECYKKALLPIDFADHSECQQCSRLFRIDYIKGYWQGYEDCLQEREPNE